MFVKGDRVRYTGKGKQSPHCWRIGDEGTVLDSSDEETTEVQFDKTDWGKVYTDNLEAVEI